MYTDKYQVLQGAPAALNRPDLPWVVYVEGESIVTRWKVEDPNFFSPMEINDETRQFTFTVTLTNKGTWKESDRMEEKSSGVSFDGKNLNFGKSSSTFKGKSTQKSMQFSIGLNDLTGQAGFAGFKFDTTPLKQSVRDYLSYYGWKKAGLFG